MAITEELSDEERAIIVFLKRYFEAARMPQHALDFEQNENISDIRAILNSYREFYKTHETH